MWCIPAASARFVAAMEHILDLYELLYNPLRPMICFDESSKQLIAETRIPLPASPGHVLRFDYEYKRNGTRNLFLFFEPLAGWRHVEVTEHRTKLDFAHQMRWLVDVAYPDAECIDVVMDNLNTHTYAALYEAFEPAEARRIARKLAFHFTPKHASWLNMAEIEFSVFMRKLGPRVPDEETLKQKVNAIETSRNQTRSSIDWQFTTDDARIKLKRLYPSIPD
jgi:transposase